MNTCPSHFNPEGGGSMCLQRTKSTVRISKHYVIIKHVAKNNAKPSLPYSTLKPNFIFRHFLIDMKKELVGSVVPCDECTYEHSVLLKWLAESYIYLLSYI
jgi:hypothetical protein